MYTQFLQDFRESIAEEKQVIMDRRITLASGPQEHSVLLEIANETMDYFRGLDITVVCINGEQSVTREEITACFCFDDLGEELLLLDKLTAKNCCLDELECDLEVKINCTTLAGRELLHALIGKRTD